MRVVIIGSAQYPIAVNAVAGKRKDDPFSFDDAISVLEEAAGAAKCGRLGYNPGHGAMDPGEHIGRMKVLQRKAAEALCEPAGDAFAGQPAGELPGVPVVFEGPHQIKLRSQL